MIECTIKETIETCSNCHGIGTYRVYQASTVSSTSNPSYNIRKCDFCKGKGKVKVEILKRISPLED